MIHQAKAIGQKVLNFGPSLVTAREFRRQKFQRAASGVRLCVSHDGADLSAARA